MKQIEVKRLDCQQVKAADIPSLFKTEKVEYHKIDTVDWPSDYPYCPHVEFAIAHKGDAIMIHYRVEEDSVRAVSGNDLGPVWRIHAANSLSVPMQKEAITILKPTVSVQFCSAMDRHESTEHLHLLHYSIRLTAGLHLEERLSTRRMGRRLGNFRWSFPCPHSSGTV